MDVPAPASRQRPRHLRRTDKVSDSVAREIVHRIVAEDLAPGTRLPAEAQMLVDFGVGRASLREALRILEVQGLLTIKAGAGGGPIVREPSSHDFGRMATLYFQVGGVTFRELLQARAVLEPVMARRAADRRGSPDLDRLLEVAGVADVNDDSAYVEATRHFRRIVGRMAENRILDLFCRSLEDIVMDHAVDSMVLPLDRRQKTCDLHRAVAEAIRDGQRLDAGRLMRDVMNQYISFIEDEHPDLLNRVVDWR